MRFLSLVSTLLFALPLPSLASDGIFEINQSRAVAGAITVGDDPGFPVRLSQAGSYRLTSDLDVPSGVNGIDVAADSVWLDLNGFAIRGPLPCGPGSACAGSAAGISGAVPSRTTVQNGQVANFADACVLLGRGARVERLLVQGCRTGIVTQSGLVASNRVRNVLGAGLLLGSSSFRDNNVAGGLEPVLGGRAAGGNLCANRRCSRDGRRRFYLTRTSGPGPSALTACGPGFHFASIWELLDVSALTYAPSLGETRQDVDTGPPADLLGWAGSAGDSEQTPRHCDAWTSASSSAFGNTVAFSSALGLSLPHANCNFPRPSWCVED